MPLSRLKRFGEWRLLLAGSIAALLALLVNVRLSQDAMADRKIAEYCRVNGLSVPLGVKPDRPISYEGLRTVFDYTIHDQATNSTHFVRFYADLFGNFEQHRLIE